MAAPALPVLASVAAAAAGIVLALHHPLWPVQATIVFAAWVVLAFWRPGLWLYALPAALPWLNFMPWTGWMMFDEFDLLLLGAIAGGYARWWLRNFRSGTPIHMPQPSAGLLLALLLGALGLFGLWRGFTDAGGGAGWYQGYAEPLNSLRIFKPLACALLLWPLLRQQLQVSAARTLKHFGAGMVTGLCVVTLAVLWERAAFPGLWDFSSTYRTTALFWEMHVGGGAIDAYLALALPFAAWALWSAQSPLQWAGAAALALAAFYACLTTFSRGVYVAVAGPMLTLGLWFLARRFGFEVWPLLRRALVYLAVAAASAVVLFGALDFFGLPAFVAVSVLLFALLVGGGVRGVGWRSTGSRVLALLLMLEVVAVAGTGNFMASRLGASHRDLGSRLEHWGNGLGLLSGAADWTFGIGLGRLPASYSRFVPGREFSGAATWVDEPAGRLAVRLEGPKTQGELGGQFALTQRVPLRPEAAYHLEFDVRVLSPADLVVSVCDMHLLYEGRCQLARVRLLPADTSWQHQALELRGPTLGKRSVPRLRVFAMTLLDEGDELLIDNLRLTGAGPDNLLRNGDFSSGLAHWLPAATSYFVPWHIDNLYLELLIERGLTGWLAFMAAVGLALRNLVAGPARHQPMAPFLAAAVCGGLIVGLVSSLMDVPRIACLYWLLLFLAISLDSSARPTLAGDRSS